MCTTTVLAIPRPYHGVATCVSVLRFALLTIKRYYELQTFTKLSTNKDKHGLPYAQFPMYKATFIESAIKRSLFSDFSRSSFYGSRSSFSRSSYSRLDTEEVVAIEKRRCHFFDLLLRDTSKLSFLSCEINNKGPYPFPSLLTQILQLGL